jgi:class 3 adenylate cyclase
LSVCGREDVAVEAGDGVRYAMSGNTRLAFRVRGHGSHEIVMVPTWLSNQDAAPPSWADTSAQDRLWSFATVVTYDQRGTGISDPVSLHELPTLEGWADDLHAVVTTAGVGPAVLVAGATSGPIAVLYAATRPEQIAGLVLINTSAAIANSDEYDAGRRPETLERIVDQLERTWGTGRILQALDPDLPFDAAQQQVLARLERQYMPPATAGALMRQGIATDVRAVLPVISAPTLVVHTVENRITPVAAGRYLAAHIPDARLVELPGRSNMWDDAIVDEIEEFVTGARGTTAKPSRMLTTLLFTDVVASTDRLVAIGDRAWRAVLDRHDDVVRRQLDRFSGREEKFTGDGVLATFDGPARAIRCGTAIRDAARQIGLEVRVGIHTGEVERRGTELAGVAVHLAHRVSESAHPGEILVSRTVPDLVAGSGIMFDDRGEHNLKGIPARWRLFAVTH